MRFITWNMGRSRATHEAAWYYLLSSLKPDVACIQETLGSADRLVLQHGVIVWARSRPGGTGVFVRHGIEAHHVPAAVAGSYLAGVSASMRGGETISVYSIHVGPESWKNQETLEPWIVRQICSGPCVIGGDFNISRTFSSKHKAYFDRLRESGVHDCCCKDGKEAQSFWGHQSRARTYQDDHFFSSESIAGRVTSCCVMDNPRTRILSDHGPVVLDFE